jgi:predicted MFS family arabinose efflux permease
MGAFLGGVMGSSIGIRFTMWIAVAVAIVFLLVVGHFARRMHREAVQAGEAEPSLPA